MGLRQGDPPPPSFGEALQELRVEAGMRWVDVEEETGISHNSLAHYFRGTRLPRLDDFYDLVWLFARRLDSPEFVISEYLKQAYEAGSDPQKM